jgi:hypothetical protein
MPPGRPRKPPPEGVTLRAGALVPEAQLAALAGAALDRGGLTSTAAAERLGVSLGTVSDAVNKPEKALTALRLRILALAGYGAEGPLYRITKQ